MFSLRDRVDLLVRLAFGAFILIGCYFVVEPFITAILLAAVLTVVSWPMYQRANNSLGGNSTVAATLMVTVIIVTVLIPLSVLCAVLAHQIPGVVVWVKDWIAMDMPLPGWITSLPYVGTMISDAFHFGISPEALKEFMQRAIDPMTKWVVSVSFGVGNGLFQVALVAFISFFFYRDGERLISHLSTFLDRISGGLSREFNNILVNTTRSVVFGLIGTAIGQGIVAGIGFFIAGVPGAALLSFLVCMLSVVPIGPPLIWGPVALWLYSTGQVGMAVFMVLWGTLAISSVDNFIKPILISRGTSLPLALVFLGVFGGILSFGFLGLVLGPILLAVGLALFQAWIAKPTVLQRELVKEARRRKLREKDLLQHRKEPGAVQSEQDQPQSGKITL